MEMKIPTKIEVVLARFGIATNGLVLSMLLGASVLGGLVAGVAGGLFPRMILAFIAVALAGCLFAVGVFSRPYWIVLFLVAFMPFEDFLLKFLPGSASIRFGARFVSELLIYFTALALLLRRLSEGRSVRRSPVDVPLVAFVFFALISVALNRPPLVGSFVNIRVVLRYAVLFYLVINLDLRPEQIRRLLTIIIAIGLLQAAIGAAQLLTGGAINRFLLPRPTNIGVAGISRNYVLLQSGRELGSIFGTLGDTIFFALFMIVVLAVYLGRVRQYRVRHVVIFGIFFLAANFAYTRAVVFGMLLMGLVFYRLRYGFNRSFLLLILAFPLLVGGGFALANSSVFYRRYQNPGTEEISILENVTGIFTVDYVQRAQWQRLGTVMGVPATVLTNRPFFGYGPDETTTLESLEESYPNYLQNRMRRDIFEDVYWTAMLSYYGLFGVISFGALIYGLYRSARKVWGRSQDRLSRELAFSVALLVAVTPFLLFFYRVVEFRVYSFYFWLLAGLMICSHLNARRDAVPSQGELQTH